MSRLKMFAVLLTMVACVPLPARAESRAPADAWRVVTIDLETGDQIGAPEGYRDVARCGGFLRVPNVAAYGVAPVNKNCSAIGTRTVYQTAIQIRFLHGYSSGSITARVTGLTFGGVLELTCHLPYPYVPGIIRITCTGWSGAIGFEQIRLDGISTGVGGWEVAFLQAG